ncbi:GspH/FimT family pseudopilin [Psychrobium sp. 1_MG-2023]|uniref:GspH/FimT family pseudopilin n=1 Tax=Psychrobium sp. 1_MG-2023 TaxID=3062624 RepID=UPI000C33E330|nr:GspH/FimT family pseudopilin [Psychrobium sp. 1_MG-2023]MDP2560267.1 GspH/FimT family pseudopilin [Psychrobium sp. 1_MG-2023]PKF55384.1 type II secretion system protein GspH [Alteromonadales bacterium alter-6D02]
MLYSDPIGNERQHGYTLVELLIVLTLIAIAASIAMPSFVKQVKDDRLVTTVNKLNAVYKFARSEAVKRDETINIHVSGIKWLVLQDLGLASEKTLLEFEPATGVTVTGLANLSISKIGTTSANEFVISDLDSSTGDYRFCTYPSGQSVIISQGTCP